MHVIGTAGHVDHGKSLLVEALTGIDPDRLGEEKRRGMTIDLGFAWLTLPSGRTVSMVDVPGHERFIKNMLAGAGGVDLALLVVAADDGVMPQTREHLAILDLLGVSRGVVAITKCDLVGDDWLAIVREDVQALIVGTSLHGAPIVACSAVTGAGLDELAMAIDDTLADAPPPRDRGEPRLPIDRVFTIEGFGTVVTGTLIDGSLATGMEVMAYPDGPTGRIRGLQTHKLTLERAVPGTRVAVNVAGVTKSALRRGMVLAPSRSLHATSALDVRLRATGSQRVRHNMTVTLHVWADEALAQVRLLDADDMKAGDEAWAQLKLASPVAVRAGDRFVIRTPNDTVGGGVIVDTMARRHRRRDAAALAALDRRLRAAPDELVLDALRSLGVARAEGVASRASLDIRDVEAVLATQADAGAVLRVGDDLFVEASQAESVHAEAVRALGAYHGAHRLRPGMPAEELRTRLRLDRAGFEALAAGWADIAVSHGMAALVSFEPRLTASEQEIADRFVASLGRAEPFGTVPERLPEELLGYLVRTGSVVDAGDGVLFEAGRFARAIDLVRSTIERQGQVTVAQARTLLGTNRRFAQAFLEHLDRMHLTRRVGDARVWRGGI